MHIQYAHVHAHAACAMCMCTCVWVYAQPCLPAQTSSPTTCRYSMHTQESAHDSSQTTLAFPLTRPLRPCHHSPHHLRTISAPSPHHPRTVPAHSPAAAIDLLGDSASPLATSAAAAAARLGAQRVTASPPPASPPPPGGSE